MATRQAPVRKSPSPAVYEATCPTCGMTADVAANVEQVRCRTCGTVIRLFDHPVAPAGQAAPAFQPTAPEPVDPSRVGLGITIGLLAPFLVAFAFGAGHDAVDQPEPAMAPATMWYLVALLLAAATVFALWVLLRPNVMPRAAWGLFGLIPTLWATIAVGTSYADNDFGAALFFLFFILPALGAYLLAMVIVLIVAASRGNAGDAMPAVLVGGAGITAGVGLAAAYLIMTMEAQAEAARLAHQDAPAWGLLLTLGTLLALAAMRRRRLTP